MGELVELLARAFASEGERAPSASNVRRWTAKKGALGLVTRSITMGGDGGGRSIVSLMLNHPTESFCRGEVFP